MSRANAFDAFYRESRERLLHQVYAFAGDPEVARRALSDGYVSAAQHWTKAEHDPEAWVRARAFKAASHRRNRSREAWYLSARRIRDEHRPLLAALAALPAADRHVLIASALAGRDPEVAAREAGLAGTAAGSSLDRSRHALAAAGVEPEKVTTALSSLRSDLPVERVNAAKRLRTKGDLRRRESQALGVGVVLLALTIGAGSINAARRPAPSTPPSQVAVTSATTSAPSTAPADVALVRRTDLSRLPQVRRLDPSRTWTIDSTSSDFGEPKPSDECLDAVPTVPRAKHYWTRTFSSGHHGATLTQTLEEASTRRGARVAYRVQLRKFGTCVAGSHRVVTVKTVRGAGSSASLVTLQYATVRAIRTKRVAIGRTGTVVTSWILDEPHLRTVPAPRLTRLLGSSVDRVCGDAGGECATPPYRAHSVVPPSDPVAPGFLSTVDLPLFSGLSQPWVATRPAPTTDNPAATECDQADFTGAGAASVRARSFVIPAASRLSDLFGMTQTIGTFPSLGEARAFVGGVATAVAGCSKRQVTLSVTDSSQVTTATGSGFRWRIELETSPSTTLVFRVAVVRVGRTVTEVTFTPSGGYDAGPAGFATLASRAAQRLTQL
jgi:DNA-directed RNA polymerase specialized sigma24 family protein